jgi:hypothetical protein
MVTAHRHFRHPNTECGVNGRWVVRVRALYLHESGKNVLKVVARHDGPIEAVDIKVTRASFVKKVVTHNCSQRTATGSGVVCQCNIAGARYLIHLIGMRHQSVHDHVCSLEVAKFVCKHVQSNQTAELLYLRFFSARQKVGAAGIYAAQIAGEDLWVVFVEGCRSLRLVPCRRSRCSEELGPRDKEVGVQCEAFLLLPGGANQDVKGVFHVESGGSQRCSVQGSRIIGGLQLCAFGGWWFVGHDGGIA